MKKKILIFEDDRKVLEILSFVLGRERYQVIKATDALAGVELAERQQPDLILLDLTPSVTGGIKSSMDNFETCRCLREEEIASPILMCITKDEDTEKAFSSGADDCIKKPFAMKDLLLRINVNTWHMEIPSNSAGAISKRQVLGRISIYPDRSLITKDDTVLSLNQREYNLICRLAKEPGKVVSREELMREVWGYTGYLGDLHAVDVTISRLREKIEDDPAKPTLIITRRGHGYVLAGE